MHHAGAVPQDHGAAGDLTEILAEVPVGHEKYFFILGDSVDDLAGVARGDDPIAQRLGGGGAVDVGDGLEDPAIFAQHLLVAGEAGCGATVCQAAACFEIGQDDCTARVEDFGGLGHEVDAAKHNDLVFDLGGLTRQMQAVACDVCQGLDFALLVIVSQDDGILFFLQRLNLGDHIGNTRETEIGFFGLGCYCHETPHHLPLGG